MKNEIEKIIAMVQEGKLRTDEASELIHALKGEDRNNSSTESINHGEKTLKVSIQSSDREDITINLPIKVIKSLLKMGHDITRNIPQVQKYTTEIDMDLITHAIDNDMTGKIIDMTSSNGDLVTIHIE